MVNNIEKYENHIKNNIKVLEDEIEEIAERKMEDISDNDYGDLCDLQIEKYQKIERCNVKLEAIEELKHIVK